MSFRSARPLFLISYAHYITFNSLLMRIRMHALVSRHPPNHPPTRSPHLSTRLLHPLAPLTRLKMLCLQERCSDMKAELREVLTKHGVRNFRMVGGVVSQPPRPLLIHCVPC